MRTLGQFVGVLLVVGFVGAYFWWIVAAAAVVALAWMAQRAFRDSETEEAAEGRRRAAIAARADQQHQWVLQGDERGVYGQYPAAL
jgi:type II secretory pathway pseudopilin PulG